MKSVPENGMANGKIMPHGPGMNDAATASAMTAIWRMTPIVDLPPPPPFCGATRSVTIIPGLGLTLCQFSRATKTGFFCISRSQSQT